MRSPAIRPRRSPIRVAAAAALSGSAARPAAAYTAIIVAIARVGFPVDGANFDNYEPSGLMIAGFVGLVVFRVWEIVDAWSGPPRHNRRVRELRVRVGAPPPVYSRIAPYVDKPRHGSGSVVGLSLRF